jgi:hypothetical protein
MKLQVLGAAREITVKVASVECCNGAPNDVHVLLRHPYSWPKSIPR